MNHKRIIALRKGKVMPIEKSDENGFVASGEDGVSLFALIQFKHVLGLELKGIKIWQRSVMFNMANFGLIPQKRSYTKADREAAYEGLCELLDSLKPNNTTKNNKSSSNTEKDSE